MPEGLLHPIHTDEAFVLGDVTVNPFAISHDANEPSGYRLECGGRSVAVATDLGKYDDYTVEHLKGSWRPTMTSTCWRSGAIPTT